MMNRKELKTKPWWMPTSTLNSSLYSWLTFTLLTTPLYRSWTAFPSHSSTLTSSEPTTIITQQGTMPKAFSKPMNAKYNDLFLWYLRQVPSTILSHDWGHVNGFCRQTLKRWAFFQFLSPKTTHKALLNPRHSPKLSNSGTEPGCMWLGSKLLASQPNLHLFIYFLKIFIRILPRKKELIFNKEIKCLH